MDQLKQHVAYRDFKIYEIKMSVEQNSLYHELLDYMSDKGVNDAVKLNNEALAELSCLTMDQLLKARNQLKQIGLIEFRKNKRSDDNTLYKIVKIYNDGLPITTLTK